MAELLAAAPALKTFDPACECQRLRLGRVTDPLLPKKAPAFTVSKKKPGGGSVGDTRTPDLGRVAHA